MKMGRVCSEDARRVSEATKKGSPGRELRLIYSGGQNPRTETPRKGIGFLVTSLVPFVEGEDGTRKDQQGYVLDVVKGIAPEVREGQQDQTGKNSRLGGRSFLNGTEKHSGIGRPEPAGWHAWPIWGPTTPRGRGRYVWTIPRS